ncbi:MAG: BamA/TamA family outer membrane protein [Synechococcales cyanobacterium CRU_2_2]|nr:BamA/TamA family outer membrane protein [Synechococcales cyanobacterium CRU_2_2]
MRSEPVCEPRRAQPARSHLRKNTLAQASPVPTSPAPTQPIPRNPVPSEPVPSEPVLNEPVPALTQPALTQPGSTRPAPVTPGSRNPGSRNPGTASPGTAPNPSQNPSQPVAPPAEGAQVKPPADPRVLVAEVKIDGIEGNPEQSLLEDAVYGAIRTQPGQATTSTQLQADLNAIFATGYFANVNFRPEDTPLGVRVVFLVEPNPILQGVTPAGTQVLPESVVAEAFGSQYGRTLNFKDLQSGVKRINAWYQENGYVLAQVVDATQISPDGRVTLEIAEGIVDSVDVKFLDADGNPTTEEGEPVRGRTKPYVVTREFSLKPGDVFNRTQAERDLQRVFGLGLFQDVRLSLDPSPEDPRKVIVVANVIESRTANIGATGGVSSSNGLFGSVSLGQDNFRGRSQKLRSEVTLGQREFLFDVGFTDPWIKGDPYRTGYTVNAFRRRSISLNYSGGDRDIDLPNGDTPRILRTGGGVRFSRPLSKNVFEPAEWNASLGLQYQRVNIRDEDGDSELQDELGNDLTFSGKDADDLVMVQLGLARDRRNNRAQPTAGSITRLSLDQSVPIGSGSILMNRLRANHSQYLPVRYLKFTEGCKKPKPTAEECPQTLAFNVQAGTILGDLPPYEAFSLGGANSIRGYGEGEVGSGRSFLQASAEYRFPMFSFVGGALFADYGTDVGTGDNVPGNPAGVRQKPGSGYGVGIGVRVRSPLGPIRADYTLLSDDGDQRFQFGIGERF